MFTMKVLRLSFLIISIAFILSTFCLITNCTSKVDAQPGFDQIHNWPITVRELPGSVQFSGIVKFQIKSDTTVFTRAIDISYYKTILPIYTYVQVGDSEAVILAGFEGTSHPGVFDSTFFFESEAKHFEILVTNQTKIFLCNYETGCPSTNVGLCFNQPFGMQYLRLKFTGMLGNTIGAEVRWSILMQKLEKSKESRAFKIVSTKP